MKESESLELEPPVSVAIPAEAARAATMPVEVVRAQAVLQEGLLGRKHDVEGSGKKSSNRSAQAEPANHSCSVARSTPQVPSPTVPCRPLPLLRSWNNLYCVLKPGQLSAYKDAKSLSQGTTYHGEEPLTLANASWEILTNYKKKKHVFKLR